MPKKIQDLIQERQLDYYQLLVKSFEDEGNLRAIEATHSLILNIEDECIQAELIKSWRSYMDKLFIDNPMIAIKQAEYSARAASPISQFQIYAENLFSHYKNNITKKDNNNER